MSTNSGTKPVSNSRSQIGHLTLKSSVYAPTAMSHMGQDLIMNHMQSHYRRIVSAKASVDTSPPKSMKMHIRVRDQKKRASYLHKRDTSQLSARSNMTNVSQHYADQGLSRSSSVDNVASSRHARKSSRDEQKPRSSTPLNYYKRPESAHSSRLTDCDSQGLDRESMSNTPNKENSHGLYQQKTSKLLSSDNHWDKRQPKSSRDSDPYASLEDNKRTSSMRESRQFDSTTESYRPHETKHKWNRESSVDSYNKLGSQFSDEEYLNENVGNTPRRTMLSGPKNLVLNRGEALPTLATEELSFSYKGPPSSRRELKTVNVWEEEQLYLRFISDVTTDILARGVFSNRVLQQVFESHIERRKHQLDEEHMREMIDQLKDDLDITDFLSQS